MPDDPWARMRAVEASRETRGRFANADPVVDQLTWRELAVAFVRVTLPRWVAGQVPRATLVEDSSAYVGLTVRRSEKPVTRRIITSDWRLPLVVAGRRVSVTIALVTLGVAIALALAVRGVLT